MTEPTVWNTVQQVGVYLGLILLYIAILWILAKTREEIANQRRWLVLLIICAWLVCSAVLMTVAPAGESHDIFDYVFRGRMMTVYHGNPLANVPDDYNLSTPYTLYLAWRKNVDTYGPVWEIFSAVVSNGVRQVAQSLGWWNESAPVCPKSTTSCRLFMAYITGYRLLAITLTGLSGWLIAKIVELREKSLVPLALATWLINPITLIASALGGHNDAVLLVLFLLSCWLLQRRKLFLGLMALILAAHVKLTALIWLPVCAFWIFWQWGWRQTLKIVFASGVCGILLSWLLYVPFGGWQTLPRMLTERSQFLSNSIWQILEYSLRQWGHWPLSSSLQLSATLPTLLFAVGAVLSCLWMFDLWPKGWGRTRFLPGNPDQRLMSALTFVGLLYLAIGSFWFQHWYILWVLAPAALRPETRLTRSLLPWLAFGALSSNLTNDYILTTTLKSAWPMWKYLIAVATIWIPFLIAITVFIFANRQQKNPA